MLIVVQCLSSKSIWWFPKLFKQPCNGNDIVSSVTYIYIIPIIWKLTRGCLQSLQTERKPLLEEDIGRPSCQVPCPLLSYPPCRNLWSLPTKLGVASHHNVIIHSPVIINPSLVKSTEHLPRYHPDLQSSVLTKTTFHNESYQHPILTLRLPLRIVYVYV